MQLLSDRIAREEGCHVPCIENGLLVCRTIRNSRKGGFTDYGIMFVKMIYKPLQLCLIHCRLIVEQGFSLFLLLLPTSPSENTSVWGYLTVAREEKAEEHFGHDSRTQIHLKYTVRTRASETRFTSHPHLRGDEASGVKTVPSR